MAISGSAAGGAQQSPGDALNRRLASSANIMHEDRSPTAEGISTTISVTVSRGGLPTNQPEDRHPGYERNPLVDTYGVGGSEPHGDGSPHGSGSIFLYDTPLGIVSRSVTDNVARVTTVVANGFEPGQHVGMMGDFSQVAPSVLRFDPPDVEILEAEDDWFTYDATLPDGGECPDEEEIAFSELPLSLGAVASVFPVLGSVAIDTTQTWDPDAPPSASPPAVFELLLTIPNLISDRWPSVAGRHQPSEWLHSLAARYIGTRDWEPSVIWQAFGWTWKLWCNDMPIPGWANLYAGANFSLSPPGEYPRQWYWGQAPDGSMEAGGGSLAIEVYGIDLDTGEAPPARLTIHAPLGLGYCGVFLKSDEYPQNPIGEYKCTGEAPEGFGGEVIGEGTVVHVQASATVPAGTKGTTGSEVDRTGDEEETTGDG